MKRARQASVPVQANGPTDLLVAAAALRHRHVALRLAHGRLGALRLLAGVLAPC